MTTVEKEKSEARALLRSFASNLTDQRAVDGYVSAIMAGEEGLMDHVCWDLLDPIHALREEFAAWQEGHVVHDDRCRARHMLADIAKKFDEPTPQFAHEEIDSVLDVIKHTYLHEDEPETKKLICRLVQAIYDLRDDMIAWGRDDLTQWEQSKSTN